MFSNNHYIFSYYDIYLKTNQFMLTQLMYLEVLSNSKMNSIIPLSFKEYLAEDYSLTNLSLINLQHGAFNKVYICLLQ